MPLTGVTFTETSLGDAVVRRDWDLGNGTIITNGPVVVSTDYLSAQKYYISLTITFANGDVKTKTDSVLVYDIPTINVTGDSVVCLTATRKLNYKTAVICPDGIAGYKWMIDADSVANTADLNYNYRIPGTHTLKFFIRTVSGCVYSAEKIIVIDYIATYFGVSTGRNCGSGTVTFTNYSVNIYPFASYIWSYGDGSSFTGKDESHFYTNPGNYSVKLLGISTTGCRDSTIFIDTVKVLNVPQVVINGQNLFCVTPANTLQYTSTITSVDVIRQYKWSIDGSTVANVPKLDYRYTKPGSHTLTFSIKTSKGCEAAVSKIILVDSVKTNFSISKSLFCSEGNASFTNLTKQYGAISNFIWGFGDGTTSSATDAVHNYTIPGKYTVKLYAETINGCKDSTSFADTIKIYAPPTVAISGKDIICLTSATALQYSSNVISSDAVANYKWMLDADSVANTANLAINYRVPGKHTLRLDIKTANGCSSSASKELIIDSIKTNFSVSKYPACGGGIINFTNLSAVALPVNNYTWQFGDNSFYNGMNASHNYIKQGNYTVKLLGSTQNGCSDSTSFKDTIRINIQPSVKIDGEYIHCKPGVYQYYSVSTAVESIEKYKWYVDNKPAGNDKNLSQYFTAGNHIISLKVNTVDGCSDISTKNITVDSVQAGFTISQNKFCSDTARVQFSNMAASRFTIVKYEWLFGDIGSSSLPNPVHTYRQPGMYDVSLIITTENGCADTITQFKAIEVDQNPVAAFSGQALHCAPGNYLYAAKNSNSNWQYQWTINGNDNTNVPELKYNFSSGGIYKVALKIITEKGCTDSTALLVKIDSVAVNFNVSNSKICADTGTVRFNNLSASHFVNTNFNWNFGDGNASNTISPQHFYDKAGTYVVSLKATTVNGCSVSLVSADTVRIYSITASINGDQEKCMQQQLLYHTNAVTKDIITSYNWKLNNNNIGNTDSIKYNFINAGDYTLSLHLQTATGCTAAADKLITIHPLPKASVSADTIICRGNTIQLRSYGGTVYQWTPSASLQNANTASPYATPLSTTKFFVSVGNQFGCKQNDTLQVTVDLPPALTVSKDEKICIGTKVQLKTNATTRSYQWSPSTGLSSTTEASPFASPAITTNYQVIAYSNNVCKNDTAHITVAVGKIPVVNAGQDREVTIGRPVELYAQTNAPDIAAYLWSPTVGFDCIDCSNPKFIAGVSANYKVTVTTIYGCTASDEVSITATAAKGTFFMPNAFSPNNDGLNDHFYVRGNNIITVKSFVIFNRYGQKIFENQNVPANDAVQGWDGYIKGEPADAGGTYIFLLSVIDKDGKEINLKGTVTVVR